MTDTTTLTTADLAQFTGTETWYRHGLIRSILYTEGARYVAETAGAYWLLDEIATNQLNPAIAREEFQHWKLTVKDSRAVLTCDDGDDNIIFRKKIEFTDFPLDEIRFYFSDKVILLPSEY